MKRLILGLVFLGLLSSSAFAKKVSVCTAYLISTTAELKCGCDIDGSRSFIIVFEK
jgi:hypothetical protein